MKKVPQQARELDPDERTGGFSEVVATYTEEQAFLEASRCLQCKDPACISGCPVGIDIKKFIAQIVNKDYRGAYLTIREKNNFPSICGRVCPAEYQCRKTCVLTKKGEPFASALAINIHLLERFAGDYGMQECSQAQAVVSPAKKKIKVAVVGSGPAGLCCAGELAREGIKVTIFEGLHKPGGVLRYGIPPFRLPSETLDYEINSLRRMGVEIMSNSIIGRVRSIPELFKDGFAAVFLGLGAGTPSFLGIEGENLCNVYSANEFLTRVNLMSAHKFPQSHTPVNIGTEVIVVGGGNTAIDAARVALRLQKIEGITPNTTILYRRTEVEMPARRLEIKHAKEEGVKIRILVKPTGFFGDQSGFIRKARCLECKLGEPDSSGRRRPVEIPGSDFELGVDQAIIAIGLKANEILTKVTPGIKMDKYGDVIVDPKTMQTSLDMVFAGGDIVGGEGTVIEAMGMAKRAAKAMIDSLLKK